MPGTVAQWDEALDRYGTISLRKALQPGIDVARRGFTVDQTFFDQTTPNVAYFDDIPSTAAIYLDPDGTPRDVGSDAAQPGPGAHVRAHRPQRRRRLLPRPARARDRRGGAQTRRSPPTPTTPGGPA